MLRNATIVFGSLTGNTRDVATYIGKIMNKQGLNTSVSNVREANVRDLQMYDIVIFGCSTWDGGNLQYDFRRLNNELMSVATSLRKYFAVFGLGNSKFPEHMFCNSINILENTIKQVNGVLIVNSLRLDYGHNQKIEEYIDTITSWTERLVSRASSLS